MKELSFLLIDPSTIIIHPHHHVEPLVIQNVKLETILQRLRR